MNKNSLTFFVFLVLFLCFSCKETDDTVEPAKPENPQDITEPERPAEPETPSENERVELELIRTIDFSASVDEVYGIYDIDAEEDLLYFIGDNSIYRVDLGSATSKIEFLVEDIDNWPNTLKVIDHTLYYQGEKFFSTTHDILEVDLNRISDGVVTTHDITGVSRSELFKKGDKLFYLASADGMSPESNFYELNRSSVHPLIAKDEFLFPKNMKIVGEYLYFSSTQEVRRFDLNLPNEASELLYTVSAENTAAGTEAEILGFEIIDDVIFYTIVSDYRVYAKDLKQADEEPLVLLTNEGETPTAYGKVIIANGKLIVEKRTDKQFEVFTILQ